MALWDILGKSLRVPIHVLLGGTVRETVPYFWYVTAYDRTPEAVARQAREGVRS